MIRLKLAGVLVALGLIALFPNWAAAQGAFGRPGVSPFGQPNVSPFINLLRNNSPAYLNYYGLVRPEQNAIQNFNLLRQDVNLNRDLADSLEGQISSGLPVSGHSVYFLNTGGYFLSTGYGQGRNRQFSPGSYSQTRGFAGGQGVQQGAGGGGVGGGLGGGVGRTR